MQVIQDRADVEVDDPRTHAKDHAVTGSILAVASAAWFGWGHVGERFTALLSAGMVAGLLLVVAGVLLVRARPGTTTMASDPAARRTYWVAMGAQAVAIVVGALVLARTGHPEHLPAWVLGVVGLHFLPLATAFGTRLLTVAGGACLAVAVLAAGVGPLGGWPSPTVAGGGGGLVLASSAAWALGVARRG